MAKFCGVIGYVITNEIEPGVYVEEVIENEYYGDVIRNTRRLREAAKVNDDIKVKVKHLNNEKETRVKEVINLDNDSTLKLFYELVSE